MIHRSLSGICTEKQVKVEQFVVDLAKDTCRHAPGAGESAAVMTEQKIAKPRDTWLRRQDRGAGRAGLGRGSTLWPPVPGRLVTRAALRGPPPAPPLGSAG